ncbi:MAG TPA: phytoene/squalene synthase family protein [Candidatus Acidoferrales bacterium]|nr:phytoene/squalene synthase family protein [Candidatus Acidoferrales bacterium]
MPDASGPEALGGELAESYSQCRRIARVEARNFYYGFRLLPAAKHSALCALYAFMRWVDDISDAPGDGAAKARGLELARETVERVARGETSGAVILPALAHTLSTYGIPRGYLDELIAGAEMDLGISSYRAFDDLRVYCHEVAGIVGQCCVRVFGFKDPRALELADRLGLAFQLTNILRDVAQDFALGRVYLPQEDLERFGCRAGELAAAPPSKAARELFRFEAQRARGFYEEGAALLPLIEEDSRAALWALARIYGGLLGKMEARDYDVTSARVRLSAAEKTWIVLRARFGLWSEENGFETHSDPGRGTGRAVVGSRTR